MSAIEEPGEENGGDASFVLKLLDPESHLRSYVKNNVREDGRELLEERLLQVSPQGGSFSSSLCGSSMVQLGATRVACGVTLYVGTPALATPAEGEVVFDVTLNALCSLKYDQRGKADDAFALESLLDSVFNKGRVLDKKQLCIEAEKSAFRLSVSLMCLSHAGNLEDTVILAALAALANVRLPTPVTLSASSMSMSGVGSTTTVSVSEERTTPLVFLHTPIPVTLGLFDEAFLLDPSIEEEQVLQGRVTIALKENGDMCYLSQSLSASDKHGISLGHLQESLRIANTVAERRRQRILLA